MLSTQNVLLKILEWYVSLNFPPFKLISNNAAVCNPPSFGEKLISCGYQELFVCGKTRDSCDKYYVESAPSILMVISDVIASLCLQKHLWSWTFSIHNWGRYIRNSWFGVGSLEIEICEIMKVVITSHILVVSICDDHSPKRKLSAKWVPLFLAPAVKQNGLKS